MSKKKKKTLKNNEKQIDPNKCLSPEQTVDAIDYIFDTFVLYLNLDSIRDVLQSPQFHNPFTKFYSYVRLFMVFLFMSLSWYQLAAFPAISPPRL